MGTMTTIGRLPANWDVWEGSEEWCETLDFNECMRDAVCQVLRDWFGDAIVRVGDEIHGPATLIYGDEPEHGPWKYQRDTPATDEIQGVERLAGNWIEELLEAAAEQCQAWLEAELTPDDDPSPTDETQDPDAKYSESKQS